MHEDEIQTTEVPEDDPQQQPQQPQQEPDEGGRQQPGVDTEQGDDGDA